MDLTITPRTVSNYINQLPDIDLRRIFWSGARLWVDTANGELCLTFGRPLDGCVHQCMQEVKANGQWVWTGLLIDELEGHATDEYGAPLADWPGVGMATREHLLACVVNLADQLRWTAENASEIARSRLNH